MEPTKKLEEIIKYAIKRGYTNAQYKEFGEEWIKDSGYLDDGRLENLIFSHQFLQTFFGETWDNPNGRHKIHKNAWQFHAQRLVILPEEKRIDYLYEHIKET